MRAGTIQHTTAPPEKKAPRGNRVPGQPGWYGYPTNVCATWEVKAILEKYRPLLTEEFEWSGEPSKRGNTHEAVNGRKEGWIALLGMRMSMILGRQEGTIVKKVWLVANEHQRVVDANWVDALCIACHTEIEDKEGIVTLPGNIRLSREMIECRAEFYGQQMTEKQKQAATAKLLVLSAKYVLDPRNARKCIEQAPLNALGRYRSKEGMLKW